MYGSEVEGKLKLKKNSGKNHLVCEDIKLVVDRMNKNQELDKKE